MIDRLLALVDRLLPDVSDHRHVVQCQANEASNAEGRLSSILMKLAGVDPAEVQQKSDQLRHELDNLSSR